MHCGAAPPAARRHRFRKLRNEPTMTSPKNHLYRVAVIGAAGLKGKELGEVLNQRNFPAGDIRLLDDDESLGQLEGVGDAATFIQALRAEQFEHVDFTFFACDESFTREHWRTARRSEERRVGKECRLRWSR